MKEQLKAVEKNIKQKPCLNITSKDLPDLKDKSIGDAISLNITGTVKSLRQPDRWELENEEHKKGDIIATLEINIKGANQSDSPAD